MARRRSNRSQATVEPAVVAQANPPAEQRARFQYIEDKTVDPFGETVVQGKVKQHPVCRRQPVYVTLASRKGICDRTRAVLAWYDQRLGLARKGLLPDSLAKALSTGTGGDYTPTEAAISARSDVDWARSIIADRMGAVPKVFDDVMERELSFTEIGAGNNRKEARARSEFKLAANWLMLDLAHRVLAS